MRLCLFTDTLADINGVSRFVQNIARQAALTERGLTVVTSTRRLLPDTPGVVNLPARLRARIPRYRDLEVALPSWSRTLALVKQRAPQAIHVSTPGPIGLLGRRAAQRLGLPLVGTYHTDFPAYIDHLFDNACLTWAARAAMRRFYRPFDAVLIRSRGYAAAVAALGVPPGRIVPLAPGIDTAMFHRGQHHPSAWDREGIPGATVKVLAVGRVSVEKNLPLLVHAWRLARLACGRAGIDARLVVIGDGPYRPTMERELAGAGVHFLGFRYGDDLATLYASADLLAFPSATDTLGQVALEALACGLPVLVSDRGGPPEMIQDGVTGLVLPASDAGAWAAAIAALAADPQRRARMGAAASAAMAGRSIGASFDHFWAVHEAVVRARSRAGGSGPPAAPGWSGP